MEDPYLISLGLNGILEEIRDLNESDFREGNNIIDDSSLEWGDRIDG